MNPGQTITYGYLEFANPTIEQAIVENIKAGNQIIIMLPVILLAARHGKNDMPSEMLTLQRDYPEIKFHLAAPLGLDPLLMQLAREHIITAEAESPHDILRSETCLVVIGRGTTDPDANSEINKLARMLEEGMGFGGSYVCFSGTAKPLVADGLRIAAKMGFKRLVVFPFFLFDGILVKRIVTAANELRQREPDLDIAIARHLGAHPLVAETILNRANEAIEGHADMNCSLCKYRVQIIGYEQQLGEPQQAHHLQMRNLVEQQYSAATVTTSSRYCPHPIEAESFRIIEAGREDVVTGAYAGRRNGFWWFLCLLFRHCQTISC